MHETESQVILNGSRDINFTMDLVRKDIGLFQAIADRHEVPLELSPLLINVFADGEARYGARDLNIESSYEYGARVGYWRLLKAFTDRGLPGTVNIEGDSRSSASRGAVSQSQLRSWLREWGHD